MTEGRVSTHLTSEAAVATDRPDRYGAQLAKHFARKIAASWADGRGELRFAGSVNGWAELRSEPGVLRIWANAPDEESLARLQDVVARHLVRFGQRDELTVTWS